MHNPSELHNLIATALTGMVKQIKAIRYYPPRHPALQSTAQESLRGFELILANGNHLSLTVRKEGFLLDDSLLAKSNQVLGQFANFCFARRIQSLTFLTDLNSGDLHHFVHYLLLDPQIIQRQGGMQVILEKARLATIWTNIHDLDEILRRRKEIEALPRDPDFDPAAVLSEDLKTEGYLAQAGVINLEILLTKMEQEQEDSRFQDSTQELIPLLRLQLIEEQRALILRAFLLLCRCATGKQYSEERKQNALQALDELLTDEMTNFLVAFLFAEETGQKDRDRLVQVLTFVGSKIANRLMEILIDEGAASKRKLLNRILIHSSSATLPTIYAYLDDDRWYVVRNAIAILGDRRNQESLVQLTPLLQHDDMRVRRETIRTLTKIGGKQVIKTLIQTAIAGNQELRRQAIISLGAIRAIDAIPTLLTLLKKSGWNQSTIDLKKDAIRALGEICDPGAIPALAGIVVKKSWLHRQPNDELRIAAAVSLGDIADESTRDILEKVTHDRTAAVARAAAQALKQLDKADQ